MEKVTATVTIKKIVIGDEKYLSPHDIQIFRAIFAKHGVTHVIQRYGMTNHMYGDQPDGEYEVGEWLDWAKYLL